MNKLKMGCVLILLMLCVSCATGGGVTDGVTALVTLPFKLVGAVVGAALGAATGMGFAG